MFQIQNYMYMCTCSIVHNKLHCVHFEVQDYAAIYKVVILPYSISSGYNESIDSEVVIEAGRAGPFSTTLQCHLERSTEAISMLIQGHVQVCG